MKEDNYKQESEEAPSPEEARAERHRIGKLVDSHYDYIKKAFDGECKHYINYYKHEFTGLLPERLLKSDRVDVNVVYPIVKTLIPNLYFQDPKVWVKSLQAKISVPVIEGVDELTGEEILATNPETGMPLINEYDGPESALIFQNALNNNIDEAKLKWQIKSAILDAHLTHYGAVKCGWGNEQGVHSMGDGAPPSVREDIPGDSCYGIRLAPWTVIPDIPNFYNPEWIAVRYIVKPEQLKNDSRLSNTEGITGQTEMDKEDKEKYFKDLDRADCKLTVYYEMFLKPCAKYPRGKYYIWTPEVKDAFLYDSEWPLGSTKFPIKLLYFNPDPLGGLPIPDVRYYANHQKAKLNIRNAEYEYIQRTLPILGVNMSGVNNTDTVKKQIENGQIPRVVTTSQNPDKVMSGVSFPSLNIDFRQFDANVDNDVSRVVGMTGPSVPVSNADNQLASALKLQASAEQLRQNERVDIVTDFLTDIVSYWAELYQEFAGPDNYTEIEGRKFPIQWTSDQIKGKFKFKIKPFSMNYEDPMIRRKQWVDLLNLLASPELRMALAEQGVKADVAKIVKRILETYDERDVENFVMDEMALPEVQAARAIEETQAIAMGGEPALMVKVEPTDNHKLHILIHQALGGEMMLEHMTEHEAAMMEAAGIASPGGGNAEGMPVNGVASNQDLMNESASPSMANKKTAMNREASKP